MRSATKTLSEIKTKKCTKILSEITTTQTHYTKPLTITITITINNTNTIHKHNTQTQTQKHKHKNTIQNPIMDTYTIQNETIGTKMKQQIGRQYKMKP